MEEIATEEAMILNGSHPELLHFLTTLSQRKERHTNLASLRRNRDKEWIHEKRKADGDAIWSWWRVQKDGLTDDMVVEANGKQRKLGQEKRSLDNREWYARYCIIFVLSLQRSNARRLIHSEESIYSR